MEARSVCHLSNIHSLVKKVAAHISLNSPSNLTPTRPDNQEILKGALHATEYIKVGISTPGTLTALP